MSKAKIKDRVYSLLRDYPNTRNCDATLTAQYWYIYETQHLTGKGSASSLPLANLKLMTPSDSITRCRRKIQNEENRFWPTDPKVAKARNINMESWREWANMKRDTL